MKKSFLFGMAVLMVLSMSAMSFAAEEAVKEWTFMVFLNADNNLDRFGVQDLNEMEQTGSTDKVNVIALMDREHGPANIYYVTKDNSSEIKSTVVKAMGEMDMGDYKEMVKFVKFCKDNYPAKKYALVIWNHGSGWKKIDGEEIIKGISYDDSSNNHITTPQMGLACKQIKSILGKNLDILSNDACLMAMLEISAEVKDYVDYFVASEETEPGNGYGYQYILPDLAKNPTQNSATYAKKLVTGFWESYGGNSGYQGTTQSAVAQNKVDALLAKVDALALALQKSDDKATIQAAHNGAQKFYYRDNVDLGHFASLLTKSSDAALKSAAAAVVAANDAAVLQNKTTGSAMRNATGIAIYIPKYSISSAYSGIALGKSQWPKGIQAVIDAFKAAKPEVANIPFNMEYPEIVAQAVQLELERGQMDNFDLLVAADTDAAKNILSTMKQKIGAEVLGGNEGLKSAFDKIPDLE